ncbi:MAG: ribosome biogenesis GTP-binding protein YihA/YsxC [Burkholderiales bacterium]
MPESESAFASLQFLTSVGRLEQLPPESLPELAFAGRSNVGKSSALNALARRRRLAFFSRTPGRTQTINFFELGGRGRLVDLPGYGYARAPRAQRAEWDQLVGGYLADRRVLAGVVVLMDARRPFMPLDELLLEWLRPAERRLLVLLSKADKLSRQDRAAQLRESQTKLASHDPEARILLFSSTSGEGVEDARALLESWLRAARAE